MSNQLDDFFKNKLQQRSFDYDESAWEEARLLIEKEENHTRRRRWLLILSSLCLISLVGFSAYQLGKGSATIKQTPSVPIQIEHNDQSIHTNHEIAQHEITPQEVSNVAVKEDTKNSKEFEKASTQRINHQRTLWNTQTNPKNKNEYLTSAAQGSKKQISSKSKSNFVEASGVDTDISVSSEPITTYSNPIYVKPATPEPNNTARELTQGNVDLAHLPILSTASLDQQETSDDLTDLLPALISPNDGLPSISSSNKWSLGVRAGTVLTPINFSDVDGGVFVAYHLNRNLSLSFQPHYTYQQLEETALLESEIQEFGFGLRSSAYSLQAESIRTIHAPLMLSYAFGNGSFDIYDLASDKYLRNKLSLGLAYVYLDGITGSISQKEAAGAQSEYETGWLPSNSFNRHNAEVLFSYERFISKRFSLGVMARYRVRDQFSDSFTQQNRSLVQPSALYFGVQSYFKLF